jgi:hypothetical protein
MQHLPVLLVADPLHETYYDQLNASPIQFTEEHVYDILDKVRNSAVMPKSTQGYLGSVYQYLKFKVRMATILQMAGFTIVGALLVWFTCIRKRNNVYSRLDDMETTKTK